MKKVDLLLINPPFHQRGGGGAIFPLGLGYIISAIDNDGYSWDIIDCSRKISTYYETDLRKLEVFLDEKLVKYSPELIGIGPCITTQVKALKIIANCCRRHFDKKRIFAGGPLASIENQEWFFFDFLGLDYIIKGDGENAILEGMKCLKSGGSLAECQYVTTKNYSYFNEISDLDEIAFPYRPSLKDNIVSIRRSSNNGNVVTASMITSRGCIYNCYYCVSGNMKYKKFRKRSNKNIVDELEYLKDNFGVSDIIFYDDCFFYKRDSVNEDIEEFCKLLIEKVMNVTWQMEIRPDILLLLDTQSILMLEKSGCRQINIGIEKTSVEGLRYLGKNVSLKGIAETIANIKQISSIKVAGTFILGGADEKEEDIKQIISDSKKMNLDFAHYNPLFVYPGTPIYETVFDNEYDWVDYIINDPLPLGEIIYENEYLGRERLLQLVESAYSEFYKGTKFEDSLMVENRFNLRKAGELNESI